ncbi:extracellular catalytic domain type 1 short-chain-length polyhydroxyalkanoate depolymerase [Microbulbifer sediminum]|uniref:extracellular catalytic domain type 1 short-chain-length polyhydroxyalkanoate depolymerase n=1 Tax=Microbulbifer sediminum TaxID=2904250 RepID=UPI001F22171C|nr:PHB depolymerase family esterase [Microbulbifer sediminum]
MKIPTPRGGTAAALAAALCIPAEASAGNWQEDATIGGFDNVHIYTPDGRSSIGDGKALLIMLHGCVQPIDNYLAANLEDAAEEFGMVVAVPEAMNKAGYGCWSYWEGATTRGTGDYQNLIQLATALSGDAGRDIDPNQLYIAGLSSGASFANTTACLAPDVFAGVGVSAGPSIGTSASGALGPCESADVASRCRDYAGSYAGHLETQLASIAHGTEDTTVNACYNEQNASGMAKVYGVARLPGINTISDGARTAKETLWQDGRVSMLWLDGVAHSWSGGEGAAGSYISSTGINYARYLGQFFLENNRRAGRDQSPESSQQESSTNGDPIPATGSSKPGGGSPSP